MDRLLHIELVTETYPPDVNGVALTVQSLEQGLRRLRELRPCREQAHVPPLGDRSSRTVSAFDDDDVLVVFDKVRENTRGITSGNRVTYSEAANLALNQTRIGEFKRGFLYPLALIGAFAVLTLLDARRAIGKSPSGPARILGSGGTDVA